MLVVGLMIIAGARGLSAQAALLMEQPFGFFGTLNPTGHAAIYLSHICADTPVHVRECGPGEDGVVISRYKGIAGYDWVAIPLIPYLYAVGDAGEVPERVDEGTVNRLRDHYHEKSLTMLGEGLPRGNIITGGWTELVGTAYDRRTYAFRFSTTPAQDRELIRRLNNRPNRSHFNLFYNNCADFDRYILRSYFPHKFGRAIFPDAGITTPKLVAHALVKYAKKHPEIQLTVMAIPQVPGYRRDSRSIHGVAESLIVNGYVIPIVMLNPYVAGGLLADYLIRGRYHLVPKDAVIVGPENMDALVQPERSMLTQSPSLEENPSVSSSARSVVLNGQIYDAVDLAPSTIDE
jgi:hypothetical protein